MLLTVALAVAGPLAPMSAEPSGVSVAGALGLDRDWLHDRGCTGDGCEAVRHRAWQGFELSARVVRPLGAYARVDHAADTLSGASTGGEGWAIAGGLQSGFAVTPTLSVDAWAGLSHSETKAGSESSTRTEVDVGLTVGTGSTADNVVAWIGLCAIPWSVEQDVVLDGALTLTLEPMLPGEVVGGILFLSEPLAGRPARRGRLIAGVDGSLGFRTSLSGWVGAAF